MQEAIEVLKGQLYFWVARSSDAVRAAASVGLVLQIDSELTYEPFASDFGPLHLGCTYRFCNKLNSLLRVRISRVLACVCTICFLLVVEIACNVEVPTGGFKTEATCNLRDWQPCTQKG